MNLHTRLIGAIDAVMLASAAFVTVALLMALLEPITDLRETRREAESAQAQHA